jgi:hypothetical protein
MRDGEIPHLPAGSAWKLGFDEWAIEVRPSAQGPLAIFFTEKDKVSLVLSSGKRGYSGRLWGIMIEDVCGEYADDRVRQFGLDFARWGPHTTDEHVRRDVEYRVGRESWQPLRELDRHAGAWGRFMYWIT